MRGYVIGALVAAVAVACSSGGAGSPIVLAGPGADPGSGPLGNLGTSGGGGGGGGGGGDDASDTFPDSGGGGQDSGGGGQDTGSTGGDCPPCSGSFTCTVSGSSDTTELTSSSGSNGSCIYTSFEDGGESMTTLDCGGAIEGTSVTWTATSGGFQVCDDGVCDVCTSD